MASMALLLRAFSRRSVRSAASAASRSRFAASSCAVSGGANRLLFQVAASSPSLGLGTRGLSSSSHSDGGAKIADPEILDPESGENKHVEFVAEEKDIESDEALWALYERWCKAFRQERDHDEMVRRFEYFKKCVFLVHRSNNGTGECGGRLGINMLADGKLREHLRCDIPFEYWRYAEPGMTTTEFISGDIEFTSGDTEFISGDTESETKCMN